MSSIALDDSRIIRARVMLAREAPSRQQEARFRWTKNLTLAAFGFAVLWIWLAASGNTNQRLFLIAAAGCYAAAVGFFLSNLSILWRLWRMWRIARRLGFSGPRVRRARTPVRERLKTLMLMALYVPGIIIIIVSGIGFSYEMQSGRWPAAGFAAVSVVFGVMCLLMHPMARVRERLHAISDLHSGLERAAAAAGSAPIEIHPSMYDDLSEIERLQIEADRAEAPPPPGGLESARFGLHITAAFFQALAALDEPQAQLVRQVLDELSAGSLPPPPEDSDRRAVERVPVSTTNLSVEVRRSGRRIEVLGLFEGGRRA